MELSKRLQAVIDLLEPHPCVADIGCDHGFVSIYLIQSKKAQRCVAMDVNKGPIQRAAQHILEEGLSTYIETRLSDGGKEVKMLSEGGRKRPEVQAAVIAGMGGRLTIKIIQDSLEKFLAMDEFILQPQSEIWKVREYLAAIGCCILKEDMIFEDGKYYPMMKVSPGNREDKKQIYTKETQELFYHYGEDLLKTRNSVLYRFLKNEKRLCEELLLQLQVVETEKSRKRRQELMDKLDLIHRGLEWF